VPLMIQYRYKELVNVILTAKRSLSPEKRFMRSAAGIRWFFRSWSLWVSTSLTALLMRSMQETKDT